MSKAYKTIAHSIVTGKISEAELPTSRVNHRRLTVDEIKQYLIEEFAKAKDVAKVKADDPEKGWSDAELAKEIEWVKALDLQEFFKRK